MTEQGTSKPCEYKEQEEEETEKESPSVGVIKTRSQTKQFQRKVGAIPKWRAVFSKRFNQPHLQQESPPLERPTVFTKEQSKSERKELSKAGNPPQAHGQSVPSLATLAGKIIRKFTSPATDGATILLGGGPESVTALFPSPPPAPTSPPKDAAQSEHKGNKRALEGKSKEGSGTSRRRQTKKLRRHSRRGEKRGRQEETQTEGINNFPSKKICGIPRSKRNFYSFYRLGRSLGSGGFGYVCVGTRRSDKQQVAIKFVTKDKDDEDFITIPGDGRRLPVEVALMEIVGRSPCCSNVLQLLEWFEEPTQFILVLEFPSPCVDLGAFCKLHDGRLSEPLARGIMRQVVHALRHCRDRGVFHRDVKPANLLINTETRAVKLIDFGCGDLLKDSPYEDFAGTPAYFPPEWFVNQSYHGNKTTVWSIGILLHQLVYGCRPFATEEEIVFKRLHFKRGPSKACRHLIFRCLKKMPGKRPTLEEILEHEWFCGEDAELVPGS